MLRQQTTGDKECIITKATLAPPPPRMDTQTGTLTQEQCFSLPHTAPRECTDDAGGGRVASVGEWNVHVDNLSTDDISRQIRTLPYNAAWQKEAKIIK